MIEVLELGVQLRVTLSFQLLVVLVVCEAASSKHNATSLNWSNDSGDKCVAFSCWLSISVG